MSTTERFLTVAARKFRDLPPNRPADDFINETLVELCRLEHDPSDARALLAAAFVPDDDVSLERPDGQESMGDVMTLKDVSVGKLLL